MTQPARQNPPAALSPMPFNISPSYTTTLGNGLKVVIASDKRLPLVSYRLAFLSGDVHDRRDQVGAIAAVASMLTEGTANYSSRELAEKIERLGASVSASTSEDFTVVAASALSMYSSEILGLLAEIVFRPTFPEAELDLFKRNALENLKFQRSQPNFLASEQVAKEVYGEHPYSTVSPSRDDIERLSRELLLENHSRVLVPNNAILIAVGDVENDALLEEIRDLFGGWQRGERSTDTFATPPERKNRTLTIVDRPGSAQANIVLANAAFRRNSPDFFAGTVMNQVLGAGASSRVFMNLREEKGYTYGAYTRLDPKRFAGDFEATAEVRTAVTGDSLREFFYELERIRAERVGEDELKDAKNFLTGVFPIRAETQEGLTNLIVNQQLYGLPEDYLQTYRENIEDVTADDVHRVANEYVRPDTLAIVIVGDAGEVLPQAKSYSDDVHIYDTEGNAIDAMSFAVDGNAPPANAAGKWELVLDFQGQKVPVSMDLHQNDGKITGTIETVLGSGTIDAGGVNGKTFNASATTNIQGQAVEFAIAGSIDGDSMNGTLSAAIIPDSLSFEGKRIT